MRKLAFGIVGLLAVARVAPAALLFSNGPVVTGTSTTALTGGDPISSPETYAVIGGLAFTTAGVNVNNYIAADDFVLPVQSQLSTFTIYAYQSQSSSKAGQKVAPTITVAANLWDTTPVTGGSPMLASNLTLSPISSTFVGWRQSTVPGSTDGTRGIFAYTFSLGDLPNGGLLSAGTYWLQWQIDPGQSVSILTPTVTPKAQAYNTNFRLYGLLSANNYQWFETWEGGDPNSPRPYAAPFEIGGTLIPEPSSAAAALVLPAAALLTRRRAR